MKRTDQLLKIRRMSLPEIHTRIAQKLRIARERIALSNGGGGASAGNWTRVLDWRRIADPALSAAIKTNDSVTAEKSIRRYILSNRGPEFYVNPGELSDTVQEYQRQFPDRSAELVEEATRICAHRLQLFGFGEAQCGPSIPWRCDLVHRKESGLDHWSRIPYLDSTKVGDSKIVWEPNRHQHLVTLSLAYLNTRDERYAEECFAEIDDWNNANPVLRGINWSSSLELAFRAWSWVWVIHLLCASEAASGDRIGRLLWSMQVHAEFISQNLSTYFSPNTHLLGEGFALFVMGLLFPEIKSSVKFREVGRSILADEMEKQVRPDGSHAEQSNYYQRYATDFFLAASILADRNGQPFSREFRARLERMCEFNMYSAWPDGSHPMTGDADGGRLLPFGRRNPNDDRGLLSTAAVYFNRGDFRSRSNCFHEETFWLLGRDSSTKFADLASQAPSETSKLFSDAGLAITRSDWNPDAKMAQLDGGPQGMDSCGHGHADALSVLCAADGMNWLVDPGTFVYTASAEWRNHFRSTAAHNTVLVDGLGQSEPREPFKWKNTCSASIDRWATTPVLDLVAASHEGYARLAQPVSHRRWLVFCKPDYWFLLDDFSGRGKHRLDTLFHFHPAVELSVNGHECLAVSGGSRFLISTEYPARLEVVRGSLDPIAGWYSADYGSREPSSVLRSRLEADVPVRIPWLLVPGVQSGLDLQAERDSTSEWKVIQPELEDWFYFKAPQTDTRTSHIVTDADFAYLRTSGGVVSSIAFVNGSYLEADTGLTIRVNKKVREFSLRILGRSAEAWTDPGAEIQAAIPGVAAVTVSQKTTELARANDLISAREGI